MAKHGQTVDLGFGWQATYSTGVAGWILVIVPMERLIGTYPTLDACKVRKNEWLARY